MNSILYLNFLGPLTGIARNQSIAYTETTSDMCSRIWMRSNEFLVPVLSGDSLPFALTTHQCRTDNLSNLSV